MLPRGLPIRSIPIRRVPARRRVCGRGGVLSRSVGGVVSGACRDVGFASSVAAFIGVRWLGFGYGGVCCGGVGGCWMSSRFGEFCWEGAMGVARGRCRAAGVVAGVLACVLAVAPSASADVPDAPASGGASQCVPDKSTIAQCFPDKALAQAIAGKLKGGAGKTGEVLTSKDVKDTTSINLSTTDHSEFSGISSVQGLQVFTNLQKLDLSGTRVSDVSPLAKLTNLWSLDLSKTQVSDVSPLAKLPKLDWLILSGTRVSDATPLAKLTKLDVLHLSGTRVSDATLPSVAKLTNLGTLDLSKTQVSDATLPSVAKLTNLNYLFLSKTQVSDVSPLAKLPKLDWLILSGTRVSDVSPLAKLTKLGWLDLSNTRVLDLGVLHGLPLSNASFACVTSFAGVRPSVKLTVGGDGSVNMPAPRWLDGTAVAPSSTSPAGGVLDVKRGVVTWKKYDAGASYSYDFKQSFTLKTEDGSGQSAVEFSGHVIGVKPQTYSRFRDVSSSTPHAEDVLWLAHANVSTGWLESDGSRTFRGMDPVRRQDMAAFLYRLAVKAGRGGGVRPGSFRDVSDATPHASEVRWLGGSGVSTGYADGTFRGMLPVYRQDMAAFLHRFDGLK